MTQEPQDRSPQPQNPQPLKQLICQECGRIMDCAKCVNCIVNDLPPQIVRFGEAVKSLLGTGEP